MVNKAVAEHIQWVKAMAAGEQSALAQFYEATCAQVHGLVLHILKDSALAEEVTLDIYLEVWRKASHYSEQCGAPISWLMTVARSRAIDKLRIVRKERWQSEASVDEAVAMTFDPPADQATIDEQVQRIRAALYALDPKPRQALYLAYFGGMSQSEIAAYLGIPLGTVKTHIRKALLQLRKRLADLHAP